MKKTKRILSLLTALAITASSFAAMVIPASAEEVYKLNLTGATTGIITKKVPDTDATKIPNYSVADFGDGTAITTAVTQLDGWGYQHYGYADGLNETRQSQAGLNAEDGTVYISSVGTAYVNVALSFIPANVTDLTLSATGYQIYKFKSTVNSSSKDGSFDIGFTSGTGDEVAKVGATNVAVSDGKTVENDVVMVNNVETGDYSIYLNGIRVANGTSTPGTIKGIYTQANSSGGFFGDSKISDFTLSEETEAPKTVKVTFVSDANGETLQQYEAVIVGSKLTAPDAPVVAGKTFDEWQDSAGSAVTEYVAGDADTTYTAHYREGSVVSTVKATTNAFAKITVQSGEDAAITKWTDGTGTVSFENIPNDREYTYKIEKKGYVAKEGTFTLGVEDYTLTATLDLDDDHKDYSFYEADWTNGSGIFTNGNGVRSSSTNISASPVTLPTNEDGTVKPFQVTVNIGLSAYGSDANSQATWTLKNETQTQNGVLFGIQWQKGSGVYAFTGWNGSKDQQGSGDGGTVQNKVMISDVDKPGDMTVDFIVDLNKKQVSVLIDNAALGTMPIPDDIAAGKQLVSMTCGQYRYYQAINVKEMTVQAPDLSWMVISGPAKFAKVSGQTITRQYSKAETAETEDDGFTWTIEGETSYTAKAAGVRIAATYEDTKLKSIDSVTEFAKDAAVDLTAGENQKIFLWDSVNGMQPVGVDEHVIDTTGITIDNEGNLSVTDQATPGTYIITATGNTTGKSASFKVTIDDFQKLTLTTDGPQAYDKTGATGEYSVISAIDGNGEDILELVTPVWSIDNTDVAEIDEETGELTVKAEGTAKITVTITNGTAVSTAEIPVTVGKFDKTITPAGDATQIDVSDLVKADDYLVTASKNGAVVEQKKLSELTAGTDGKYTFDAGEATDVEVGVIYKTRVTGNGSTGYSVGSTIAIPDGTYKFEITNAGGDRGDIYVNEQMLVNNMLQNGAAVNSYTANDIVVSQGYATMKTYDDKGITADITITKVPANVTRVPKMFVLGDSLVCIYYNGGAGDTDEHKLLQTGWGQVLQDYITDDVEVVDLGNSGVTAPGLYGSAFTQIQQSAQEGDYLVLESGYNDKTYETEDNMKTAVRNMVDESLEKDVKVILVSPNASQHDYGSVVAWTDKMKAVADEYMSEQIKGEGEEMVDNPKYSANVNYIDLAAISYKFLFSKYGADYGVDGDPTVDRAQLNDLSKIYNVSDVLHSTYNAANCWAAVIAQNIKTIWGADMVKTEHTYTFKDGQDHDITVGVDLMPTLED